MGEALPRNIIRETEDVDDSAGCPMLLLPDKAKAIEYVRYFHEHLNATYRYLPMVKVRRILECAYEDDNPAIQDDASLALFLSVMGTG